MCGSWVLHSILIGVVVGLVLSATLYAYLEWRLG